MAVLVAWHRLTGSGGQPGRRVHQYRILALLTEEGQAQIGLAEHKCFEFRAYPTAVQISRKPGFWTG
jgi:hypothetical protein